MIQPSISGFNDHRHGLGHEHAYLLPKLARELQALQFIPKRAFDLGCGNGFVANWLSELGFASPLVISLEVIEHVYAPRTFAACVHDLLEPGGHALISTPYHGYLKNLAIAAAGRMDDHFTALWDHGHITFWSRKTIIQLLAETRLVVERIHRLGRVPALAKSMLVVARRPDEP